MDSSPELKRKLGIAVLWVAGLNLAYFGVEFTMALKLGSVSLLADSIDLLEDVAINILIFLALGWSLHARAVTGKVLAFIICITVLTRSGWPDIILGVTIIAINVFAAKEVWQIAHLEHLEARALTGKLDEEDLLD